MSLLTLSAKLDRTDSGTSWGFRLHGGKDFGSPLTIQRITPGSLASKCGLQVGDAIVKVGGAPVDGLIHKEAQAMIIRAGNNLELTLQRSGAHHVNPSGHYGAPASGPKVAYAPPVQSVEPYNQNYNRAAQPFSPGEGGGSVPVVVNNQYNTPLHLYSVDNVVDSLAASTGNMSLGPPRPEPIPPWRSPGGGSSAPAPMAHAPPAPSAPATTPGAWRPKVPTGPRKMRAGRAGEAKSMPASVGGTRIPICSTCAISIRGPFVLAMEKSWCPDHFMCSNPSCRANLVGIGFVEEEGQLFCERDYEQYFAPHCSKCSRSIMRECVNALNSTFHPECFTCCQCGTSIGSGAFHMEEGKTYCEKDWQSMFQTKCFGCQFPIEPGDRWVEALGQNWHSECFNCSTCQVNLEGKGFYAKGGRPYCKKHAGTTRAF